MWLKHIYKTRTWYRVYCRPHQSWNGKENQFLHTLDHRKMKFQKSGKYAIANKSATFAPFCYSYVILLNVASFLHKSQQLFFIRKTGILVKTGGITCLLTFYKYCLELIVQMLNYLKGKRNFNIRMYFILN